MRRHNALLPRLALRINRVSYGKGLRLHGWPLIFRFSGSEIVIGNDCIINSSPLSNMLGLYQRTIIVARNEGVIHIGSRVGISGATIYAWNSIEIGEGTIIGANVKIVDTDFHPVNAEDRRRGDNQKAGTRPIHIGSNVFIGMNALILKGSEIGDNCVIGAGAVVSGHFGDNCVIAGNPASVLRQETDS